MSEIWIQIIQFLLSISLLVLLHEGGHYFFAKLFKTRVEKFYLFFDFLFPFSNILPFSLFKKKVGETTYGIGWFPLGGYVKISGMVDESMDTDQMKQPPQPWEFRSKKAWQRLLIMMGGIIVNVLLAFAIFAMVAYVWGEKKLPMSEVKYGIMVTDSLGYKLGFQDGDKILTADNEPIEYYDEVMAKVIMASEVTVERNGRVEHIVFPRNMIEQMIDNKGRQIFMAGFPTIIDSVVPNSKAEQGGLQKSDVILSVNQTETSNFFQFRNALKDKAGDSITLQIKRDNNLEYLHLQVSDSGTLGFMSVSPKTLADYDIFGFQYENKTYGFWASIPAGIKLTGKQLKFYYQNIKKVLDFRTGAAKGIGGFGSMTKTFAPEWDWHHFWKMTGFLSIVLAFMNFLPIPGLDGGYVMFTLYEMITGKKVGDRVMEVATTFGLIFLLMLMLYANGMDVVRWWQGD